MSTIDPKNYIRIPNPDQIIYRTYSSKRFLDVLTSGRDALVNPSKWDDPFENFFFKAKVEISPTEAATLEDLAKDWYGQCWTINDDTDALWRIYSHDKDGVKVRTTVRKLLGNLVATGGAFPRLQYFAGAVGYHDLAAITSMMSGVTFQDISFGGTNDKFAELLCMKRTAFAHEAEVRILFNDTEKKNGATGIFTYPLNANDIFDEVVLDPRLSQVDFLTLQQAIVRAGCKLPVTQSDLYHTPLFTIPLE